jgi:hypothetical protein
MRNAPQLKGNKPAPVNGTNEFCQLFCLSAKKCHNILFNLVFNEDSKMGSAIFVPSVS